MKTEKWIWKCFVCGKEMVSALSEMGDDEDGILPSFLDGGTIKIDFGYGSRYDNLCVPGIWQSAICDDCFAIKKELTRRVLIHKHSSFEVQNND